MKKFGFYLLIFFIAMIVIFPFYWMIVGSMQLGLDRFTYPPRIFPSEWSFSAYLAAIRLRDIGNWLINSLLVSIITALSTLVIGAWGAYALSRFRLGYMGVLGYIILMTQMMPPVVIMIPLFILFRQLGLYDKVLGLIVANFIFTLPVSIWMLKSIFDNIPIEIEEAALIDGCNRTQCLIRITIPLSIPGLIASGIFTFISTWDEFMFTRTIITSPRNWVASIGIVSFIGEWSTPWDQIMAAATMFTVVPVILFLLVQKYFIVGLTGGVKG